MKERLKTSLSIVDDADPGSQTSALPCRPAVKRVTDPSRVEALLAELRQEFDRLRQEQERGRDLRSLLRAVSVDDLAQTLYQSLDPQQLKRLQRRLESYQCQEEGWDELERDIEKLVPLPWTLIRQFILGLAQQKFSAVQTPEDLAACLADEYAVRLDLRQKTDWFRAWALLRYGLSAGTVLNNPPHSIHQFVEQAMQFGAQQRRSRSQQHQSPPQNRQTSKSPTSGAEVPAAATVLGLPWPTTLQELKATYRRLAKANHPDLGGDPDRFQQIQHAYEELRSVMQ
nr:molecular chaperone DnaJ [Synechococcus elongatus PCC 11801]